MKSRLALTLIASIVFAGTASAGDYSRPGWYVGVGGGAGWDFLEDAIEDIAPGVIEVSAAGSFNARAGYRVLSWFAFEAMYEGIYGLGIKVFDVKFSDLDTHTIVGNFKFIAPIKRFQPYLAIGPGGQLASLDTLAGNIEKWDFALRIGVGLDLYITENWVVDLEIAPSVRFNDWSDIPSAPTDNVNLTLSGGLQYRF